jgi:exodeoxyribonuclease V gamma subunit
LSGLSIYTSNRLEILAGNLAHVLKEPLLSPMENEVIVVQSRGMERWLSLQLAASHGVCSNYRFPFPNRFVNEITEKVIPDFRLDETFEPGILAWRIMKLLPLCVGRKGFEPLKNYLGKSVDSLKLLQMSYKIADTFDQYLIFRPDMIFSWEKGQDDHWQALLWRELVGEGSGNHRAALGRELLGRLAVWKETEGLPERVSVFGISALPRFYMELLAGIGRFSPVYIFLMNPCREYWGDIVPDKLMKRRTGRAVREQRAPEELHLEKGNSLLASMGELGRDFFDLINEFESEELSYFSEPGQERLLCRIQQDILDMKERGPTGEGNPSLGQEDDSIQVHSCHGPMREVEVLQDRLLEMFHHNPDLYPRDIVVMAPDIEVYAPYVHAVFDLPADDQRRIPFSIADRGITSEGEISAPFLRLLDLKGGRFQVSRVLALLESSALRKAFGLEEKDLDLILNWTKKTRIRWGVNGESRSRFGVPGFRDHTWEAGLERLILGYSMSAMEDATFRSILPWHHLEGEETHVLGRFLRFASQLFSAVDSLETPRRLGEWAEILTGILDTFFLADENSSTEMLMLRRVFGELLSIENEVNPDAPLDFRLIRWYLERSIGKRGFGQGFITGGITFCSMLPMRSIPFKVICLLGMNSDAYPRQSSPLGFDLIAKKPRPGDRSQRKDDRYLFLEALLSAREKLYISYVGQGIQDNSMLPPSVLVGEVLDYVSGYVDSSGGNHGPSIEIKHRLQPFSPEYFKEKRTLFSYSEKNFASAVALVSQRTAAKPFISSSLSEAGEEWNHVDVEDLCLFFMNPSRFLLERRLDLVLPKRQMAAEESEPFEVKGLDRYKINQNFLSKRLEGVEPGKMIEWARASGLLPHGSVGECLVEGLLENMEGFAEKLESFMKDRTHPPVDVDVIAGKFRVFGLVNGLYGDRLIQYRTSGLRGKDRLRTWITHLVLNSLEFEEVPRTSMTAGLKPYKGQAADWEAWEYPPVENAKEILENLLSIYRSGLARPLPFFPESSFIYMESRLLKKSSREEAIARARSKWMGSDYSRGEGDDAYFQLCFKDRTPLDEEFEFLSEEVYAPMIRSQQSLEGHC